MTIKIKEGKRPETFKPFSVKFTMPEDGREESIKATFVYRTREEFGEFLNKMFTDAGEEPPKEGKPDFAAVYKKAGAKNADHLLASLKAWDLEDELTRESLLTLSDKYPAAAIALMQAYSGACTEGRLGN